MSHNAAIAYLLEMANGHQQAVTDTCPSSHTYTSGWQGPTECMCNSPRSTEAVSFRVLSLSLCCGLAVKILWGMQSLKTAHTRAVAVVAAQTATH